LPISSSSWRDEISAIFLKEMRTEMRSKSGLLTAGLFSVVTVVAIAFASFGLTLQGQLAAGLLWVALLFSAVIGLPRTFTLEEEQRTGDLLRMWARPHAVFWGKSLFNLAQCLATAVILSTLFIMLTSLEVQNVGLYAGSLLAGCIALSATVTFCGALVAQASNRAILAGAISLPMLLPLIALGIGSLKVALGHGSLEGGLQSTAGLAAYGIAAYSAGPHLFAVVWRS
jgi:heme exporter protein B